MRDDMAAFKPHDTLFLVLSLFFWVSVHEEKINPHQSDECVRWAMEQQATDRVSLELLPSRDPTPLTGKWLQAHGCSSLWGRGEKEADESHKPDTESSERNLVCCFVAMVHPSKN